MNPTLCQLSYAAMSLRAHLIVKPRFDCKHFFGCATKSVPLPGLIPSPDHAPAIRPMRMGSQTRAAREGGVAQLTSAMIRWDTARTAERLGPALEPVTGEHANMKKTLVAIGLLVAVAAGVTAVVVLGRDDAPPNGAAAGNGALSESEKIEMLIESLKALDGAVFIRNGREHTVEEAIDHMRGKWRWKKSEIKTAEDFIDIAATKSSISGEFYLIKLSDGTTVKSGDWFREQLIKLSR